MVMLMLIKIGFELALLFCAVGLLLCEKERRRFK
jgi:hypothetical protein